MLDHLGLPARAPEKFYDLLTPLAVLSLAKGTDVPAQPCRGMLIKRALVGTMEF